MMSPLRESICAQAKGGALAMSADRGMMIRLKIEFWLFVNR